MFTIANLLKSAAVITLGLALTHTTARADTFSLTLNPVFGSAGSGSLTVNGPVPNSGLFLFSTAFSGANELTALSFTIAGETFDLSDATDTPGGWFIDHSLANLTYQGGVTDGTEKFELTTGISGLGYVVSEKEGRSGDFHTIDAGYITTDQVPEPTSVILFGSVALLAGGVLRRKLVRS